MTGPPISRRPMLGQFGQGERRFGTAPYPHCALLEVEVADAEAQQGRPLARICRLASSAAIWQTRPTL